MNVLLELIGTRVSYVVQEAVVVMKVLNSLPILVPDHLIEFPLRTSSGNIRRRMKDPLRESR